MSLHTGCKNRPRLSETGLIVCRDCSISTQAHTYGGAVEAAGAEVLSLAAGALPDAGAAAWGLGPARRAASWASELLKAAAWLRTAWWADTSWACAAPRSARVECSCERSSPISEVSASLSSRSARRDPDTCMPWPQLGGRAQQCALGQLCWSAAARDWQQTGMLALASLLKHSMWWSQEPGAHRVIDRQRGGGDLCAAQRIIRVTADGAAVVLGRCSAGARRPVIGSPIVCAPSSPAADETQQHHKPACNRICQASITTAWCSVDSYWTNADWLKGAWIVTKAAEPKGLPRRASVLYVYCQAARDEARQHLRWKLLTVSSVQALRSVAAAMQRKRPEPLHPVRPAASASPGPLLQTCTQRA